MHICPEGRISASDCHQVRQIYRSMLEQCTFTSIFLLSTYNTFTHMLYYIPTFQVPCAFVLGFFLNAP
uniref:Uncharacterized protein n=1 Tax=Triticum urartu TaxID=4572 RepID=A0A8R7TK07_TRIUA